MVLLDTLTKFVPWATTAFARAPQPIVNTSNGVYRGLYLPELNQKAFLGIPFAAPPIGDLRFAPPQPYEESWSGVRDATQYGYSCYGMGSFSEFLLSDFNEDCLTLNVVVPIGAQHQVLPSESPTFNGSDLGVQSPLMSSEMEQEAVNELLPVFVWIHGGGFVSGSSADPRYNLSYIVKTASDIGKPIIAISLNYRLAGFGFLSGGDMPAGSGNQGLLDQRVALQWVHDNIKEFGGDPNRVTLAGESAGGWSIGYQIVAYGGDTQGLFQSAIMQSGHGLGKGLNDNQYYTKKYNDLVDITGCTESEDRLDCLRALPAEKLWSTFLQTAMEFFWDPVVDGKFLTEYPHKLMEEGKFVKVPLLIGMNMDECTEPSLGPRGTFNTTEQLKDFLMNGLTTNPGYRIMAPMLSASQADEALALYPDDPTIGCPYHTGNKYSDEPALGYQYKRGASMTSDWIMQAGRRYTAQMYADAGLPTFSYIFNQTPYSGIEPGVVEKEPVGVPHFHDVAYLFGIPDPNLRNWVGPDQSYHALSRLMQRMWISFVHSQDPNDHGLTEEDISARVPLWPAYKRDGEIIVFQANSTHVEKDDFRKEGMEFWMRTWDQTMMLTRGMAGYN